MEMTSFRESGEKQRRLPLLGLFICVTIAPDVVSVFGKSKGKKTTGREMGRRNVFVRKTCY